MVKFEQPKKIIQDCLYLCLDFESILEFFIDFSFSFF